MRLWSQLLGSLRQENCLNPEGGGRSEPRLCHCTPAWLLATEQDSVSKKKKKKRNLQRCEKKCPVMWEENQKRRPFIRQCEECVTRRQCILSDIADSLLNGIIEVG